MLNYDYQQTDNYLTEKNLGDFLCEFLQGYEVIHNKKVPDSNIQKRPDYRIEELGLIIEYDGDRHFKSSDVIKTDLLKEQVYKELGYTVIRIPYFLCLTADVIYELFNEYVDIDTDKLKDFNLSGHGFITEKVVLPSEYSLFGLKRFNEYYDYWDARIDKLYKKIDYTLLDQVYRKNSVLNVFPLRKGTLVRHLFEDGGYERFGYDITDNIKNEYEMFFKELEATEDFI